MSGSSLGAVRSGNGGQKPSEAAADEMSRGPLQRSSLRSAKLRAERASVDPRCMERSHYRADGRRDRGLPGTILPDCSSGAAFAPAPTAQSVGAHPAVATLSGSFSLVFEVDRYHHASRDAESGSTVVRDVGLVGLVGAALTAARAAPSFDDVKEPR